MLSFLWDAFDLFTMAYVTLYGFLKIFVQMKRDNQCTWSIQELLCLCSILQYVAIFLFVEVACLSWTSCESKLKRCDCGPPIVCLIVLVNPKWSIILSVGCMSIQLWKSENNWCHGSLGRDNYSLFWCTVICHTVKGSPHYSCCQLQRHIDITGGWVG